MKVTELFEASRRIVDLRDPDHAPGAVEREGAARAALGDRQKIAAENLNKLVAKYKLGGGWKVGESSSMVGTYIMADRSAGSDRGTFKTNLGKTEATLWNGGRYDDLTFTLYGADLTREQKTEALAKMKELMPSMYGFRIASDDRRDFKSVSFHFGPPSYLSEPKTFAGMKKFFDYLKKLTYV